MSNRNNEVDHLAVGLTAFALFCGSAQFAADPLEWAMLAIPVAIMTGVLAPFVTLAAKNVRQNFASLRAQKNRLAEEKFGPVPRRFV